MSKRLLLVLFLVCQIFQSAAPFQPTKAVSKTVFVPDNYPTTTAAIGNASDGDVIYVRNGFYNETLLEVNKTLMLRGEDVRNTIVHLNPPLINFTNILGQTYLVPSNAIKINAVNVKLSGFTITAPGGISATGNGTEIISNNITIGMSPFQLNSFITVFGGCILSGSNLTIAKNTLIGETWSLTGSYQTLVNNAISGTIWSKGSYGIIRENNISGDILIEGSFNTIACNSYELMYLKYGDSNTISNNSGRLSLGNSDCFFSNNTVSGNIIKGPSVWGIWIGSGGRNNLFHDNYIADQGYDPYGIEFNSGIIFGNRSGIALNNTFYRNVFMNNTENVRFYSDLVASGNFWDSGSEGNYWSNYNGTDADNDGVGDSPYIINTENKDSHPLIAPLYVPAVTVPLPEFNPPLHLPEPSSSPTQTPIPTSLPDSLMLESEPFPMAAVIGSIILVAAVGLGLLVHFQKRAQHSAFAGA